MKWLSKIGFTRIALIAVLILSSNFLCLAQTKNADQDALTYGKGSLNFLVISDWGRDGINDVDSKTPGQLEVAKQIGTTAEEVKASFVVTAGDNFHGNGVSSVSDSLWKVNFENVYTAKSLQIPWYITLGNHDNKGSVAAELEYAKTSDRWIQPARYFSFTKKLADSSVVLFVILDSTPFVSEYYKSEENDKYHILDQDTSAQVQWCDSLLSISDAGWKLVFFHHPAYSASSKHGSTEEIEKAFVPIFEKYHVTACFSGHDHDLQHSHPEESRIEYFGVGGGATTRPTGKASFTIFSQASMGFGVVSLTPSQMKFSFVNEKGERIYSYEICK